MKTIGPNTHLVQINKKKPGSLIPFLNRMRITKFHEVINLDEDDDWKFGDRKADTVDMVVELLPERSTLSPQLPRQQSHQTSDPSKQSSAPLASPLPVSRKHFRTLTIPKIWKSPSQIRRLADFDFPWKTCDYSGHPRNRLCLQCCLFECESCMSREKHHNPATGHYVLVVPEMAQAKSLHVRWKRIVTFSDKDIQDIFGVLRYPRFGEEHLESEHQHKLRAWLEMLHVERQLSQNVGKDFNSLMQTLLDAKETICQDSITDADRLGSELKKNLQAYVKQSIHPNKPVANANLFAALKDVRVFAEMLKDVLDEPNTPMDLIPGTKEFLDFFAKPLPKPSAKPLVLPVPATEEQESDLGEDLEVCKASLGKRLKRPTMLESQSYSISNLCLERELFQEGGSMKQLKTEHSGRVMPGQQAINYLINIMITDTQR